MHVHMYVQTFIVDCRHASHCKFINVVMHSLPVFCCQVAVEEVRRLQRHGLTPGELDRYIRAMLRDSAQLSEQTNAIPHLDSLDFVMESLALGHTCMSHM